MFARNPDPTAVQFSSSPQAPRRPPPTPQAQLQKLYFDRQFQQQIPVRPRVLRPPPQPQPQNDFPGTSQVYNIHEARLRAALSGGEPNLAVPSLTQQLLQTTGSPGIQHQEHLTELQSVPEPSVSHQQIIAASPQVQYVQQPVQREISPGRQAAASPQLLAREKTKLPRRPVPAQYLRETTQPLIEQSVAQAPHQQLIEQSVTQAPHQQLIEQSVVQAPHQQLTEQSIDRKSVV